MLVIFVKGLLSPQKKTETLESIKAIQSQQGLTSNTISAKTSLDELNIFSKDKACRSNKVSAITKLIGVTQFQRRHMILLP